VELVFERSQRHESVTASCLMKRLFVKNVAAQLELVRSAMHISITLKFQPEMSWNSRLEIDQRHLFSRLTTRFSGRLI
jgi:hypothetical protein